MINKIDREFIENKYHRTDKSFNSLNRMAYHGIGYAEETGKDDVEILAGLKAMQPELSVMPHPVARATAIKYVLENERLYINEHDYFVGLYSLGRLANSVTFNVWEGDAFNKRKPEALKNSDLFNRSGAVANWTDYDHVVPDWESLMNLGFKGIRERAQHYREKHAQNGTLTNETAAFFDGIDIEYGAIISVIDRMYKYAAAADNEKSVKVAKCLKALRDGAPTDIYEAMQLIFIYFIISESVDSFQVRSLGNGLDRTLYRFYENDLKTGRYSRDEIRSFLAYFLLQWSAIGNYWGQPFYLGGTNKDGSTKYNDLSYDILDVYDELEIYNPKIQLKINRNTPERLLNKAFDMVRRKNASIVFCCEPGMIKAVMGYGATYEEALDMDIRGCYETGVRANESSAAEGYINCAKAVEYVFSNGFDKGINEQVGIKTGMLAEFTSFEDFYAAFIKQLDYLIEKTIEISNDQDGFLSYANPSSMFSATTEHALKCGKDGYFNGLKFNNTALLCCTFASAVDSLMALKKFVYDDKRVSLEEFSAALDANWQGFEKLRLQIRNSPIKYGNNNPEADRYAAAIADYYSGRVNNIPNGRGGVYKAIMHSARTFIEQGKKTLASADSRKNGDILSKNASPCDGMDKNGVTALIESALRLTPSNFHESFCLDIMLHPSAISGDAGLRVFNSLLKTYMALGGMAVQFNIFNVEMLRDAQVNPEKYRNLQVRVCGWNVLWNNLSREEQEAYIKRAQNIK